MPVLRRSLLRWFKSNGRDYPWRKTCNWFHLLSAEIMLRRTRADQVVPVYGEFTRRFSSASQAAACSAEIQRMLHPLGLAWRATQFRKTIHYLADTYASRKIVETDQLIDIPGIGAYAEAMLRSLLFAERLPAIDANVVRIFYRLAGRSFKADYRRRRELIATAGEFVQSPEAGALNLALVDLGALVCRPGPPNCSKCPFLKNCRTCGAE